MVAAGQSLFKGRDEIRVERLPQLVVLMERSNQKIKPAEGNRIVASQMQLVSERINGGTNGRLERIEVGVANAANLAEEIIFVDDDLDRRCQGELLTTLVYRSIRGSVKAW